MKTTQILLALSLLILTNTHARLGESAQQLTTRYGQPITTNPDTHIATYQKNGITIRAHLDQRTKKTNWLTFQLTNPTQDQLNALLQANSDDQPWKETTQPNIVRGLTGGSRALPTTKRTWKAENRWATLYKAESYLAIGLFGATHTPPKLDTLDGF